MKFSIQNKELHVYHKITEKLFFDINIISIP